MPADNNMILQPFVTATTTHTGATLDLHTGTPSRGLTARVLYSAAATSAGVATVVFSIESSRNGSDWAVIDRSATLGLSTDATAGDVLLPIETSNRYVRLVATVAGPGTNPTITYAADLLMARTHQAGATGTQPTPLNLSGYLVYDSFDRGNGPIGTAETGQTWVIDDPNITGNAPEIVDGTLATNGTRVLSPFSAPALSVDVRFTLAAGTTDFACIAETNTPATVHELDISGGTWSLTLWWYDSAAPESLTPLPLSGSLDAACGPGDTLRLVLTPEHLSFFHNAVTVTDTDLTAPPAGTEWVGTPTLSPMVSVGFSDWATEDPVRFDDFAVTAP